MAQAFKMRLALALAVAAAGHAVAASPAQAAVLAPGAFGAYVEDGRTAFRHGPDALPKFDAMMSAVLARDGGLAALPLDELRQLAFDAHVANFYYAGARPDAHRDVFDELQRRGAATPQDVTDLHASLVAARRWDEARAFASRHPDVALEPLPAIVDRRTDPDAPAFLRLDATGETLVRENAVLGEGRWLLVVSHPGCAFSRRALAAIERNAALNQALPARRLYLGPTFGGLKLDHIKAWNSSQPSFPHVLVDEPGHWPFVTSWGTPQFLFLVDGVVVDTVTGWPGDEQVGKLMAAAKVASGAAAAPNDQL